MECQLLFIHLLPFNCIFSFRDFNDLGFLDNFERQVDVGPQVTGEQRATRVGCTRYLQRKET